MDVNIEERLRTGLRSSAEEVSVPDDLPARVDRRITLRRRQALMARVAVTMVVLSIVGGALWLNTDDKAEVTTGSPPADPTRWVDWQPPPAGETLPGLTVEADGIDFEGASEYSGPIEPARRRDPWTAAAVVPGVPPAGRLRGPDRLRVDPPERGSR